MFRLLRWLLTSEARIQPGGSYVCVFGCVLEVVVVVVVRGGGSGYGYFGADVFSLESNRGLLRSTR